MSQQDSDFVEETALTLPPGCVPDGITDDGHVFAFWPQPNGQIRFVWDGVAGRPFDAVGEMRDGTRLFWSDDARHVAYMADRIPKTFVGRDSGESTEYDGLSRSAPPTFSAAGAHIAYGAEVDGAFRLIIDGTATNTETLAAIAPVFSPDGTRLALVELRTSGREPEFRIVLDGDAGPWFHGMRNAQGAMQFSPDSRRFAYYRVDEKGGGQWVVDGVEHRWVNDVRPLGFAQLRGVGVLDEPLPAVFSPDSRRFAYWADVKEKGVAVIEDDVPGPIVKGASLPVFSPDGRRLAYGAEISSRKFAMVVEGVATREREAVAWGDPVFSPDGAHVAWTLRKEEGAFLRKQSICSLLVDDDVVTDQPGEDMSRWPRFGPDGDRVTWWVRSGKTLSVFVDGEAGPALSGGSEPFITSADHLLYAGGISGLASVFVDHRPGPGAEALLEPIGGPSIETFMELGGTAQQFRVSRDGEHVAWAGVFAEGPRPVVDDRVGPAYERLLSWSFDSAGVATWWAQRGQVLLRVRAAAT